MEKDEKMCCEKQEVHEDLLRIVNETMPEETELYDLANCLKYLEILHGSVSCLFYLKQRYVYAIWQQS